MNTRKTQGTEKRKCEEIKIKKVLKQVMQSVTSLYYLIKTFKYHQFFI